MTALHGFSGIVSVPKMVAGPALIRTVSSKINSGVDIEIGR
jgi:hypothetical protein